MLRERRKRELSLRRSFRRRRYGKVEVRIKLTLLCFLFRLLHHHHNPKAPKAAAIPPTRAGIATATGKGFFSVVSFPELTPEGVEEAITEMVVICCRPTRSIMVTVEGGAGVIWGRGAGISGLLADV
jgi:hypothetical protein